MRAFWCALHTYSITHHTSILNSLFRVFLGRCLLQRSKRLSHIATTCAAAAANATAALLPFPWLLFPISQRYFCTSSVPIFLFPLDLILPDVWPFLHFFGQIPLIQYTPFPTAMSPQASFEHETTYGRKTTTSARSVGSGMPLILGKCYL